MPKRSVRTRSKNKTLELFGGRCSYCGQFSERLTVDHGVARDNGGTNHWKNTIPACKFCNQLKSNMTVREFKKLIFENRESIMPRRARQRVNDKYSLRDSSFYFEGRKKFGMTLTVSHFERGRYLRGCKKPKLQ